MEHVFIRRMKGIPRDLRGPTHKMEHGRVYGQFVNTLWDKSALQDRIIDQMRDQNERLEDKFQKFKDALRVEVQETVAQAVKMALAQANQPPVEDGSTKG